IPWRSRFLPRCRRVELSWPSTASLQRAARAIGSTSSFRTTAPCASRTSCRREKMATLESTAMASTFRIRERGGARRAVAAPAALLTLMSYAGAPSAVAAGATAAELPVCPAQPSNLVAQRPLPNNVRVVRGAPYSAFGTSETVTILADGNRIVRQNTVRLWRDSDGRTRAEYSLSSIGGPVPLEMNSTLTVIDDPAAGTRYMLQPGQ